MAIIFAPGMRIRVAASAHPLHGRTAIVRRTRRADMLAWCEVPDATEDDLRTLTLHAEWGREPLFPFRDCPADDARRTHVLLSPYECERVRG